MNIPQKDERGFNRWISLQNDTEVLSDFIMKDLVIYVSEEGLDWDYPDKIHARFTEDFNEELFDYYINYEV